MADIMTSNTANVNTTKHYVPSLFAYAFVTGCATVVSRRCPWSQSTNIWLGQ